MKITISPLLAGIAANFNFGLGAPAGELHRIGDQIDQHHAQQGAVGPNGRQRVDFPGDIPLFRLQLKITQRLPDQFVEIDLRLLHL